MLLILLIRLVILFGECEATNDEGRIGRLPPNFPRYANEGAEVAAGNVTENTVNVATEVPGKVTVLSGMARAYTGMLNSMGLGGGLVTDVGLLVLDLVNAMLATGHATRTSSGTVASVSPTSGVSTVMCTRVGEGTVVAGCAGSASLVAASTLVVGVTAVGSTLLGLCNVGGVASPP